jgi:hypothetical protein
MGIEGIEGTQDAGFQSPLALEEEEASVTLADVVVAEVQGNQSSIVPE